MNKTKIEWTRGPKGEPGYTWNPIKGVCPVGCWYCYSHKIYKRFGMKPKVMLSVNELIKPFPKKPSRIFVCSTFELFHPVADKWRDDIFEIINVESQHTFIILTKMPENIDRPMPPNVWLGTTITQFEEYARKSPLAKARTKIKFLSLEPMLDCIPKVACIGVDWIVIGRLTGHGRKFDPKRKWISDIVEVCKEQKIPVFLKNNLREIWGAPLIQEFPK